MVAPGIVATVGHAVPMNDRQFKLDNLVAVFNLRAVRTADKAGWTYAFDSVFKVERYVHLNSAV